MCCPFHRGGFRFHDAVTVLSGRLTKVARLQFGVLGTLEVFVDERPVQVPAGRRRAVLTCLLVHAGSPVAADTLVEAAWGEEPPADPRAALHTVVSRLRALLGPDAVATVESGYRLSVPPAAVDSLLLEGLLARARTAAPGRALVLLERVRRLWRGPPFGELGSAPSVLAAAARLEGMRHEAAELHAAALLDLGDPAPAVPLLEELLAEEPYREHAVALLARALYRLGRQAAALDLLDRHRRRMADELGLDPSPELADLQAQILGHELEHPEPAAAAAPDRRLVSWMGGAAPLVGREEDLARLVEAVLDRPVTTVTGPGGVGKTRLAAEAVRLLTERSLLPVAVVELAVAEPGAVASATAGALRLGRRAEEASETVVDVLATTPHLLVIDEAEHLLAEVADLVGRIARSCPGTHVLVTSRRRLGVPVETVVPLAPLATPRLGDETSVGNSAAVRLFTDRVRQLRPSFGVDPTNAAAVAELCRRLDGLPIALELAASRTATDGLDEVLALLPATDDLPGTSADLGLDRTVDWSYRLLDDEQRRLLAVLSVFAGEFTALAVRAVTAYLPAGDDLTDPGVALTELVETSLVACRIQGRGARHRLLSVVREYAAARLRDAGPDQVSAVHRAHATWMARECEQVAGSWASEDGAVLRGRLEGLVPDATAALRRSTLRRHVGTEDLVVALRIGAAIGRCLHWVPGPTLGAAMLEVAERGAARLVAGDLLDEERAAAAGVGAGAMIAVEHGELERARALALEGIRLAGDPDEPLTCLALGVEAMYRGDATASTGWFERVGRTSELAGETHASRALMALYADDLAAAREHLAVATATAGAGSDAGWAFTLYAEGEVLARSDRATATVRLREAATEAERIGAAQVSKVARLALLARLVRDGRRDEVRSLGGPLLRDLHRTGSWAQLWTMLRVVAELLVDEGAAADAAFLLGAAAHDPSAPPLMGEDVGRHATLRQRLVGELGPGVLRRIEEVAAQAPRAQVVRRALMLVP